MSHSAFGCCALTAFLLAVAPSHARANDQQQLFVCGSGPDVAPTNRFELKGVQQVEGGWTDLQFIGFGEGLEPVYFPSEPGPGRDKFFFSNSTGVDGYLVNVRFKNGKNAYRLYSLHIPPTTEGDEIGSGEAGLEITGPQGEVRKFMCDERPYMFIAYMHDAMSCDFSNPYGAAGCDYFNVPRRKAGDPLR